MKRRNIFLLLVFFAGGVLIVINYYTVKILSATRAYVNGESEYSKCQKDALLYLSTLIQTNEPNYWILFNQSMQVPLGDNLALHSLLNHKSDELTTGYFLMGKNNIKDIPNLIWLFNSFKTTFMKKPIKIWKDAEPLINELKDIGDKIHPEIIDNTLTKEAKLLSLERISAVSSDLYQKESEFSQTLSDTTRNITGYLLLANILLTIIIIGSVAKYAFIIFDKLSFSNKKLEAKNLELYETNKELDTLIYSVSHDLRSPLSSIKSLINLLQIEYDIQVFIEYLSLMNETVERQEKYINEILNFAKNKNLALSYKEFSLKHLIENIIDNNKYAPLAQGINIYKDFEQDEIYSDELHVEMIINNLISNAIKYSDEQKPVKEVFIKTSRKVKNCIIEVEDNGIGIEEPYLNKIFDMFYVATNKNKGTGLGLYILKQTVEKLNGKIEVYSKPKVGTKFTISIPSFI